MVAATRRLGLVVLAACLLAIALLIGAHWVDVGDSTCGGVYRPDLWFNEGRCRGRMLVRTGEVLTVLTVAATLVGVAVRGPSRRRSRLEEQ